jgi:hypothetical protein
MKITMAIVLGFLSGFLAYDVGSMLDGASGSRTMGTPTPGQAAIIFSRSAQVNVLCCISNQTKS